MNMPSIKFCVLALLGMATAQAQFLEATFDDMPLGPIYTQSGWAGSYIPFSTISGEVTNVLPLAGAHTVALPFVPAGGILGSGIHYTSASGFQPLAGQGRMIRVGAWIYRENRNQRLSISLGRSGLAALEVYEDGDGTLVFTNRVSGYGIDTGQRMATNRYAEWVFHYDTSTNAVVVDYDGVPLVKYDGGTGGPLTNLSYFAVFRGAGAGTEGQVLVDEIQIEGFPSHVISWWRMGAYAQHYLDDSLGTFESTNYTPAILQDLPPLDDGVYDGTRDVRNRGAKSAYFQPSLRAWRNREIGTNWTFEALLREGTNSDSQAVLLQLINPTGGSSSTNTLMNFYLTLHPTATLTRFVATLRSENQILPPTFYLFNNAVIVPRDDQWHHLALVNNGSNLTAFLDYTAVATNTVTLGKGDVYRINQATTVAYMGSGISGGGGADTDQGLDEMRLSGTALGPAQFLYASSPRIQDLGRTAGGAWLLRFTSAPGLSNRVQIATNRLDHAGFVNHPAGMIATSYVNHLWVTSAVPWSAIRLTRNRR